MCIRDSLYDIPERFGGVEEEVYTETRECGNIGSICDNGAAGGIGYDGDQVDGGRQGGSLADQWDEDMDLERNGRGDQYFLRLHGSFGRGEGIVSIHCRIA